MHGWDVALVSFSFPFAVILRFKKLIWVLQARVMCVSVFTRVSRALPMRKADQ